jgi:predicted  nucleic acid-binding Zn-ribbon protein
MTTQEIRAEAQIWAEKVQDLEGTIFRLRDELTAAYDLIGSLQDENRRLRRQFKDTLDDMVQDCNNILREIGK